MTCTRCIKVKKKKTKTQKTTCKSYYQVLRCTVLKVGDETENNNQFIKITVLRLFAQDEVRANSVCYVIKVMLSR